MVEEAHRKSLIHKISISFIIQPERKDIYNEFKKQISLIETQSSPDTSTTISATIGKGVIEVEKGDITKQKVWKIIFRSDFISSTFIFAGGCYYC
jgi:hypothetical protein